MVTQMIVGIHVPERKKQALEVQKVITEYGCYIRARIGLHEVGEDNCSPIGLIVLQMACSVKECGNMIDKLKKINGVHAKKMSL